MSLLLLVAFGAGGWTWMNRGGGSDTQRLTATVARDTFKSTVSATGRITPKREADLSFSSSGTVTRVAVDVGDRVEKGDVLVQLWVSVNHDDGKLVLTTSEQPFTLDHRSDSLLRFREVSTKYQFSADVKSADSPGLPGRVFIGRLPEWSPDIRYFTSYEYPRVRDAQYLDVHGTMGLPVFEKGSYN